MSDAQKTDLSSLRDELTGDAAAPKPEGGSVLGRLGSMFSKKDAEPAEDTAPADAATSTNTEANSETSEAEAPKEGKSGLIKAPSLLKRRPMSLVPAETAADTDSPKEDVAAEPEPAPQLAEPEVFEPVPPKPAAPAPEPETAVAQTETTMADIPETPLDAAKMNELKEQDESFANPDDFLAALRRINSPGTGGETAEKTAETEPKDAAAEEAVVDAPELRAVEDGPIAEQATVSEVDEVSAEDVSSSIAAALQTAEAEASAEESTVTEAVLDEPVMDESVEIVSEDDIQEAVSEPETMDIAAIPTPMPASVDEQTLQVTQRTATLSVTIDNQRLEDLVGDLIKQELAGPFGKQITETIQSYVEAEVARILDEKTGSSGQGE
ncbi:MAG: hypothetical protein AAF826_00950 [Pseudomonadota bacterium]